MSALTRPASLGKRVLVLTALTAASAGAALFAAPAAYADTVTVNYSCEVPLSGAQTGDIDVTITAPATAAVGDTVDISVTTGPTPFVTPIDLAAGSVTATGDGTVSGAQTGTFTVTGPANTEAVPAGSHVTLPPMTGQLTLTSAGQVDLSPGTATAVAATVFGTFTVPCTPTSPPGVSASIQVS
jgi:hypothetical protein